MGTSLSQRDNGVKVDFETIRSTWSYMTTDQNSFDIVLSEKDITTQISDDQL